MSYEIISKTSVKVGDLVWLTYGPIEPDEVVTVDTQGVVLDRRGRFPFERVSFVVRDGVGYNTKPMQPFDPAGL